MQITDILKNKQNEPVRNVNLDKTSIKIRCLDPHQLITSFEIEKQKG